MTMKTPPETVSLQPSAGNQLHALVGRVTHGEARRGANSVEFEAWSGMRKRCANPNKHDWERYGGRGITVCDRWLNSFQNFLDDMGRRPSKNHSIDRIDNSKGYSPENCRWATRIDQQRNRRSNRMLTHKGQTLCVVAWSEIVGNSSKTILNRLNRGWTVAMALETPNKKTHR